MKIFNSVDKLIGNTPLVELANVAKKYATKGKILAKIEFFNPAGSIKDRVAKQMLEDAYKQGRINEDTIIIEPTSGNTGIGLAMLCAIRGNKAVIVMPDNMSIERIKIMRAYGAKVILTPANLGMKGAIDKANQIAQEYDNSFICGQFDNQSNPLSHYESTGKEIFDDTDGEVDILVCGVGTGGTITGIGKFLKEKNSNVKVVAVEPKESPVLSEGKSGAHAIQGIGAGFVPSVLDVNVLDEIIAVSGDDAITTMKELAILEGLFVGISSGAALKGAIEIASREENKEKTIVVVLPDGGNKYMDLF